MGLPRSRGPDRLRVLLAVVRGGRGRPSVTGADNDDERPGVHHHRPTVGRAHHRPGTGQAGPGLDRAADRAPPGGGFTSLSCLSDTFCIAAGGGTSGDPSELISGSGVSRIVGRGGLVRALRLLPGPGRRTGHGTGPACGELHLGTLVSDRRRIGARERRERHRLVGSDGHAGPAVDALEPGRSRRPGTPARGRWRCRAPHPPSVPSWTTPARPTSWRTAPGWPRSRSGRRAAPVPPSPCTRPAGSVCRARPLRPAPRWSGLRCWSGTARPGPSSRRPGPPRWFRGLGPHRHLLPHDLGVRHRERHRGVDGQPGGPVARAKPRVDPGGGLDSISCPSTTFCLASDEGGSVIMWNGTTWSAPHPAHPVGDRVPGDRARSCRARTPSSAWS